MDRLGLVNKRLIAVHMTQLEDDEIATLAAKGGHVVHCPSSNLKLASGTRTSAVASARACLCVNGAEGGVGVGLGVGLGVGVACMCLSVCWVSPHAGFCRVADLVKAGVNVALGTDGACSNNSLDLVAEMKLAAILAKAVGKDAAAVPARHVRVCPCRVCALCAPPSPCCHSGLTVDVTGTAHGDDQRSSCVGLG